MQKLTPADLMTLERYARERTEFRTRVMAHKKARKLGVGPNTSWLFEDRLTIQYQVQEILRTEKIFEPDGIVEELEAYNRVSGSGHAPRSARAPQGHRGSLLGAGRGLLAGVRHRR
jgi:hypothetical protein